MTQVIIYPNEDALAVVFPNLACGLTVQQIAEKDVPQGVPYLIIETEALPEDQTFFEAWEADFSDPDGFGDPETYWINEAARIAAEEAAAEEARIAAEEEKARLWEEQLAEINGGGE